MGGERGPGLPQRLLLYLVRVHQRLGSVLLLLRLVLVHGRSPALGLLDGACAGQLRTAGMHKLVPRPLPDAGSVSCGG